MNSYRNISSVIILIAYTLFLFHDYIPHTHTSSFFIKLNTKIHQHHADHQHMHHTHQSSSTDHQENGDGVPYLQEFATDDHHQHHLVYRKSSKSKIGFPHSHQMAAALCAISSLSVADISNKLFCNQHISYAFPNQNGSNQLRAPPVSI